MNEEADAKGSKEDKENHNNLDSEHNDQGDGENQDGLDATNGEQHLQSFNSVSLTNICFTLQWKIKFKFDITHELVDKLA